MKKNDGFKSYTDRELEAMRHRGEDRTDDRRLAEVTEAELTAAAEEQGVFDWSNAQIGFPPPKQQLTMRLDQDVVDWFKAQGRGYQTRINAVLRSYVEAHRGNAGR